MFYEPDRGRKRRKRRRRHSCLGRVVKLALLLFAAYVVITAVTSGALSGVMEGLIPDGLPGGWRNVLLLGVDKMNGASQRTDTMIVASISTGGDVKLTSIMRDTLVPMGDRGKHKINAAYAYGGAQLAMETVNECFGLNISQYVLVDFEGFARLIDGVGGIEMDITLEEMQAMNQKQGHTLLEYGPGTRLNGVQALRYARIRKIDSDYARAGRQRRVIQAIMNKIKNEKNPVRLYEIAKTGLSAIKTNISTLDMALLAGRILVGGDGVKQYRIPAEGAYESGMLDGVWAIRPDFMKNRELLRRFIYG